MVKIIEIPGDQIEVHTSIPPGRIISATLKIDDDLSPAGQNPSTLPYGEWKKIFDEMCDLAPVNQFPADISREAMYLSDEDMGLENT